MASQFEYDAKNRILRCRLEGRVTDEILKEYYRAIRGHAVCLEPHAGVMDFSGVTSFEVTPQTTRDLAHSEPAMPDASRPRVIFAPADHIFGMSRLFQMEGSKTRPNLHIVRTLQEVWEVLGVADPQFEPIKAK